MSTIKLTTTISISERTHWLIISAAMSYFFSSVDGLTLYGGYVKFEASDLSNGLPEGFVPHELFEDFTPTQLWSCVEDFIGEMTKVAIHTMTYAEVKHA